MKKLFFLTSVMLLGIVSVFAQDCYCPTVEDPCFDDSDLFRKNEETIFFTGEFLYWRADAGALEYAFQYNSSATAVGTTYGHGEYKIADYEYDPGFRIALGGFNAPDFWQLYGQFTWIRISGSDRVNKTDIADQPLVGAFAQNTVLGTELESASSKVSLQHELGDFLASRVFFPNPHLRLRLLGGLTGGRIKQTWQVNYTDANYLSESIRNKWRFFGVGFRIGLDIDWFLRRNFYLTGKVTTAPLVGKHKNFGRIEADTSTVEFQDIRYFKFRGVYNVDSYLGFSYQNSFQCSRIEIFAGYELDSWFNVHEIIRPTGASIANALTTEQIARINNGMFLMHGLTARLTLDF